MDDRGAAVAAISVPRNDRFSSSQIVLEPMIIRVFRACVHPEKAAEFQRFLLAEALPLVKAQRGMVRAEIGWPMPPTEDEFLMITVWESEEALRGFAGEDWQEARLLEEERPLLRNAAVHHYEAASA